MAVKIPIHIPHMLPDDVPVARRWMQRVARQVERFEFDVQVGEGRPAPDSLAPQYQKMALDLSRRRIDIVAHFRDHIVLVEVTRRAGIKAIGQLVTYPVLYEKTWHPLKPVKALLVAEELSSDIKPVLDAKHIDYILLP